MAKYHEHYERVTWANGATALSAEHMNNIESGISDLIDYKVEAESGKGLYPDADKTKLAGIEAGAQVNPGNATTSAAGLMSATDKTKIDGVAAGAEVNQNAFSNVIINSTTLSANSKTDTVKFIEGDNISLYANTSNNTVTIRLDLDDETVSKSSVSSGSDFKTYSIGLTSIYNSGKEVIAAVVTSAPLNVSIVGVAIDEQRKVLRFIVDKTSSPASGEVSFTLYCI